MSFPDFTQLEKALDITFNDRTLLQKAFTHRSYLNEHRESDLEHNERLEFLGDAVLELVATDFLFHKYPSRPEGELTAFRAALVNTSTLSAAASELAMNDYLLLSKGEAQDTGRARQYILANTFEAFVGALYIDQGYEAARAFINEHLLPRIDEIVEKQLWQDPKSRFQEVAQDKTGITPSYHLHSETGPDHDKCFVVGVYLNNDMVAEGQGRSKQEAEQTAAQNALEARGWN